MTNTIDEPKSARDYVSKFVLFQEMRINACAELDALLAEQRSLTSFRNKDRLMELSVLISSQQTYISRLDRIVAEWGDALAALGQTYGKSEYEMFVELIIKGRNPKDTKWAQQTCYNFKSRVYREMRSITGK